MDEYDEGNGICDRCGVELDYAPYISADESEWLCEECYHDEIVGGDDE